jgi:ribosome maturation factor RimP
MMAWDEASGPVASEAELSQRLIELLEPVVRSEGLILVELSWRREGRGWVLRLYVDRPEGGVTLDECALVSRQVSDLLDVEDLIPVSYHLEVSSPGLTRRLKSRREYELFAGRWLRLVVRDEAGGTETFRGRLLGLQGEEVLLEVAGGRRAFPLERVAKANLALEESGADGEVEP